MISAHAGACALKFSFPKNGRGPKNYYFLCENRHEASFYIKEQTHQKFKKLITIKNDILAVLVVNHRKIKKITPPYCV